MNTQQATHTADRMTLDPEDEDQDEPEATPSEADRCKHCDVLSPPGALRCICCSEPLDH